jgi:hypothetical protein
MLLLACLCDPVRPAPLSYPRHQACCGGECRCYALVLRAGGNTFQVRLRCLGPSHLRHMHNREGRGRGKSDSPWGRRISGHSEDRRCYSTSRERATGAPHRSKPVKYSEPAEHPSALCTDSAVPGYFLAAKRRAGARLQVPPSLAGPRCARAPGQRVRAPGAAVGVSEEPAAACGAAAAQRGRGGRARAPRGRRA